MDNIRNSQVISVIDALSRVMDIDKTKIDERLEKYKTMSDKEVIKDLSMIVYDNFKDNKELYEYFLSLIININLSIVPSVEFIKSELEKTYSNKSESMSLEENHELACNTIKYLTSLFDKENIDYCIVGALPCFLQAGIPLFRYHDDIDVMVNEDDLDKVKSLMEAEGYNYSDLRFPSIEEFHKMAESKPSHQVMAQNPYNEFHIDFSTFRREKDDSMTTLEYLQREQNGEVIVDRLERNYPKYAEELRFNNNFDYDGTNIRSCSIEHIYDLKSHTKRPKDITDMEKLENYVDKDKLKELRRNTNTKQIIKNVSSEQKMTM